MSLSVRSVMGRIRPRPLSPSDALAKDKNRNSSNGERATEKRLHVLDYWEELLGSPDDDDRSRGADKDID